MYTKEAQLKKEKKPNPKKMTKIEKSLYMDFIFEKANGKCQCGCGRNITDYHHAEFGNNGADKDDRSLTGMAQYPCHYNIHHGKDIVEKRRLINLMIIEGEENWKEYTNG